MENQINNFINIEAERSKDYKSILALIKRIFKYGVSLEVISHNLMDRALVHSVKDKFPASKEIKFYNKSVTGKNRLSFL